MYSFVVLIFVVAVDAAPLPVRFFVVVVVVVAYVDVFKTSLINDQKQKV